jgi:hypothetical protein
VKHAHDLVLMAKEEILVVLQHMFGGIIEILNAIEWK